VPYAHSGLNDGYEDQFGRPTETDCQSGDETGAAVASQFREDGIPTVEASSSG